MNLKILGSSSSGNCYILETEKEALIIECGINIDKVKQALDFNVGKVSGAIISHHHGDHGKYAVNFLRSGINVYCLKETAAALGLIGHRLFNIESQKRYEIGNFGIMPFAVQHDCPCVGYLIHHAECGNVLFLTDSAYSKYTFKGLNNMIVEANYDSNILHDRAIHGTIINTVHNRVLESHMSIQTLKGLLKANDLSKVNNIVLCHLSDGNSNEKDFKMQIEQMTGKTVHIADKGMSINFDKQPF